MQPTINYKISGEGFPFIFQHGLGSNLTQAQSLLGGQEKVQLISMDCPGHGDTPLRLSNPPSFNFYADEVIRLMEHLKIEKAIFGVNATVIHVNNLLLHLLCVFLVYKVGIQLK